jgi:hypothetical protein
MAKIRGDTVGQPPSAENHALDMPSLKAQKSLESNAVTAAVSRGKRMTNSIRGFLLPFPMQPLITETSDK